MVHERSEPKKRSITFTANESRQIVEDGKITINYVPVMRLYLLDESYYSLCGLQAARMTKSQIDHVPKIPFVLLAQFLQNRGKVTALYAGT